MHSLHLRVMVIMCAEKLSNDMCFPLAMRSKFSKQEFSFSVDDSYTLWCKHRSVMIDVSQITCVIGSST